MQRWVLDTLLQLDGPTLLPVDLFHLTRAEWSKYYSKHKPHPMGSDIYLDFQRMNKDNTVFKIVSRHLRQSNGIYDVDVGVETYRGA